MSLSYRSRRRLHRFFTTLAVLALTAIVAWLIWIIWVGRYIIYTPEGAKLDFSLSSTFPSGEAATAPGPSETVNIIYEDPPAKEEDDPIVEEKTSIHGSGTSGKGRVRKDI